MSGEILFLAHRVPYPPNRGDKIRSWHILRHMAQFAPTHVCALWDDARDLEHRATLEKTAESVWLEKQNPSRGAAIIRALASGQSASVLACANGALKARVNQLLETRPISTIFAFSGQMAQFVPSNLDGRRFVMDFVDMDSAKFAAFGGIANREEARRLHKWECKTAARADLSLFVSEAEAALFGASPGVDVGKVGFLENGIDLAQYDPKGSYGTVPGGQGALLVFTGQMDYRPNVDAVAHFAREVLPKVQARMPARFAIVGRNPVPEVQQLQSIEGVIVTGEVADTRDWLAAADLVVAPLLLARGIQNKVLEAMAMAKPVLASSAAAQGIEAEHGVELAVADEPGHQADAINALLQDRDRALLLGRAARRRMESHYSWEARLARLPEFLGMAH